MCVCACLPPATVYCFSPSYSLSSMEILLLLLLPLMMRLYLTHKSLKLYISVVGSSPLPTPSSLPMGTKKNRKEEGGVPNEREQYGCSEREIALSSPAHFHHFYRFEFCSVLAHGLFFTHQNEAEDWPPRNCTHCLMSVFFSSPSRLVPQRRRRRTLFQRTVTST